MFIQPNEILEPLDLHKKYTDLRILVITNKKWGERKRNDNESMEKIFLL